MRYPDSWPAVTSTLKVGRSSMSRLGAVKWSRWAALALSAGAMAVSLIVVGVDAPPNIPAINISADPLYAATQGDKPTLALALSVEFPTAGAQYVNAPKATEDDSYSNLKEYIGYYHAEKCYSYINVPTDTRAAGKTVSDYKRFKITGDATNRRCADAFSGNYLNWVSSSAVDMLRLALTGGDRYVDDVGLTILQRAVLPGFWNTTNFPAKKLYKGADGTYMGAVPQKMISVAESASTAGVIWAANTSNRLYFGLAKSSAQADYWLGTFRSEMGLIDTRPKGSKPSDANVPCAVENGSCFSPTIQEVWYGGETASAGGWKVAPVIGSFSCSNGVFGDPISGVGKSCYLRPYSGSWTPSVTVTADQVLNTDGYFFTRSEVCNVNESNELIDVRDYRFCIKYPNNKYKPIGTIQKYNDQLRLAAFGYAMQNTLSWNNSAKTFGRYGGVLRAPMKYVGPRTYDGTGQENTPAGGNPGKEWDPSTGIFYDNPDNVNQTAMNGTTSTSIKASGVINYLNKFGRTGVYKTYDTASEMYYETLRYLQGLPPSPAAVADLTTPMYDNFPIYTDWSGIDPYANRSSDADYSCLKSNIALIGDIHTHDSRSYGNSRLPAPDLQNNIPDIEGWITVVRNGFEKKGSVNYVDGAGVLRTISNPNAANSVNATRGEDLIALSYWAHTHDIRGAGLRNAEGTLLDAGWANSADAAKRRPGLRVKSFFFDVNEYAEESVDSQRRTNNQYYTAAKYGGFLTQPSADTSIPYNTRGNPFYTDAGVANNNIWQKSNQQLEPQTYFLQSDARGVLSAFEKIFSEASSAERSIAGAATGTGNLTRSGAMAYQASFDTSAWTGDLEAFEIKVGADGTTIELSNVPTWSAEQKLAARLLSGTARNIVVGKTGVNPTPTATAFTAAEIEPALKTALNQYTPASADDGLWNDRLNYLRGDKTKEGNPFRRRYRAMGDIVNSGVTYVGAPSPSNAWGEGYAAFAEARKNRTPVVYVGANDGMLHAFNAQTGDEVFAYIPSWLGPKLGALTSTSYIHQSYVDATSVVGDAKTGANAEAADWKTVLVSGTGGGGRGVFALDVSDPAAFDAGKVMWEFTQADDADMGFVLGKPRIVKMRTSAPPTGSSAATPTYRWFAMVASGVNNYVPDAAGTFSTTGAPAIFLLALDKPSGTAWTATGSAPNYYKISLPFDATLATTMATGLINLEAFTNPYGIVDYVFAGDLHGKLWSLNFTGVGASDWNAGMLSRFSTGSGATLSAFPMYIAKDSSGNIQPITAAPTILQGPQPDTHYVSFGTGKYIEPGDATSVRQNTFYVLYDNGAGGGTGGTSGVVGIAGRGRLRQVNADTSGNLSPSSAFVWGRAESDADATQRSGWYHDLSTSGERVVYDSVYVPLTTTVAFSSLIPDAASAPGVCSVSGGSGNNYYVDLVAGKGVRRLSSVGIAGQPMVFFNDESTTTTKADSTGRKLRTVPVVLGQQGSKGLSAQQIDSKVFAVGRLSWRQINDYLELKNK